MNRQTSFYSVDPRKATKRVLPRILESWEERPFIFRQLGWGGGRGGGAGVGGLATIFKELWSKLLILGSWDVLSEFDFITCFGLR